ncbi:ATPase family AAA domain-containing protein 5 [Esox lucius]|uniref:AAA+ ATPase domain-containing protein n=1 Tax=Esox lucius TaxID=8010 RepID=A0A3P8XT46_ESOLU|nr:ATPase family AAA domain-containing protein 5 [Esox lucius]
MMAGVVAMASVIEDFDTQSCKKSCKDSDSPAVKTIANYFSPVSKAMEKHFSPPRSNNIMNYFSRKTPPVIEKGSTVEQTKENQLGPQSTKAPARIDSPVTQPANPPQKRGRKPNKAARELHVLDADAGSTQTEDYVVLDCPGDCEGSEGKPMSSCCGILGSDTAALLAQFSADVGMAGGAVDDNEIECLKKAQKDKPLRVDSKNEIDTKKKESCGSSPKIHWRGKVKRQKPAPEKKTCIKAKAKQQEEEKDTEECAPEVQESQLSLCDASMEVNPSEESQLNGSTVTISFKDFLQSQEEEEEVEEEQQQVEDESKVDPTTEKDDLDKWDEPKASKLHLQQISPPTLTVQAEVHSISPGLEPVRVTERRVASIFSRGKGVGISAAVEMKSAPSPCSQSRRDLLTAPRWRSNVVMQEEDLEIDVVESESSPKCNQIERKQFMSAFKQPAKPGKGPGKQPADKASLEAAEDGPDSSVPVEDPPGNKTAKKICPRRGRTKALEEGAVPPPVTKQGPVPVETVRAKTDAKPDAESPTSTPTTVRRSPREGPRKKTPVVNQTAPVVKTKKEMGKDVAAVTEDCLFQMSTPKSHKSKRRVFRAQMVCPPDDTRSPIRMKFTRVFPSTISAGGIDLTSKESSASKKRKKAKKLVEKARAMQQSKKAAVRKEDQSSSRRSSRSQVSIKKSYNTDEDSVVCLEEESQDGLAQTGKGKSRVEKRSLNDVLGKKAPASKEAKNSAAVAPKVAPMFLGKKAQRTSVTSIFDDSSHDGSDNSQDDEQFRARREFLKSGLPESIKMQRAKTAANKEAYTVSCSSFQPVVHVLQAPQDCPLWNLPWPVSPLLHCLKKLPSLPSNQLPSRPGFDFFKTEPASRAHCERGSGFREEFSEPTRKLLMGEISASNPSFPVQRFFTRFLKRRGDHLQQCTTSDPECVTQVPGAPASAEPSGGKRKRVDEGDGAVGKVAKKLRSRRSDEGKNMEVKGETATPELEPPRRGGRGRRRKQEEKEKEETKTLHCSETDPVIVLEDSPLADNPVAVADFVKEDVLWTEKYQPQHSSDIIGNTASVRRLHSWLKEWKLRADREERKKQKEKKQEEDSNDSWDTEDVDSQEGEELIPCNTLLITGPTGVGKTAAVYACAHELGFKVFEVNASSQRNGRQILSQLKEATQSHQVDIQGVNANKPCYFNSFSSRAASSPRKVNSPGRVVSSPRKPPQSPRGVKRGSLAPTSLANFFKTGRPGPTNKEPTSASKIKKQPSAAPKRTSKAQESSSKTKEPQTDPSAPTVTKVSSVPSDEQSKKTATSLILFEEVDVIFDDDSGFLAAIKTFMTTTKRPVILTTSDPTFCNMFDGYFEEINFKTPSTVNVSSYLQLLCLAENMRLDAGDISSLLHLNGCDIRQSLMHLQFWSRSAGGRPLPRPLQCSTPTERQPTAEPVVRAEECERLTPGEPLPRCDTGCTENVLGLFDMEPRRDLPDLLKSPSAVEPACWELLTTSRRRGLDLLYSNMEALLPLPTTHLTVTTQRTHQEVKNRPKEEPSADPQDVSPGIGSVKPETDSMPQKPSSDLLQQVVGGSETDESPVKVSSRVKRRKKQGTRKDQDPFLSDSDSDDTFLSLRRPSQGVPQVQTAWLLGDSQDLASVKRRRLSLTPEQRLKSRPVSSCLGSMAEFFDHVSLLDSCLRLHDSPPREGKDLYRTFGPRAHIETKDGMTDEPREEFNTGSWVVGERAGEIQTAVEALSFQRCRVGVEAAWDEAQGLEEELRKEAVTELTLPVAPHRQGFRLTQDSLCEPTVLQRRREVQEVLPARVAGALGNRLAAALDFLPCLRAICRSETLKEQGKVKRRFLHYLNAIHLDLPKNTLQHLAEAFP